MWQSTSDEEIIEAVEYSRTMPVETHECEIDNSRSESGNEEGVGNLSSSYFFVDRHKILSKHMWSVLLCAVITTSVTWLTVITEWSRSILFPKSLPSKPKH
jgi:hypothetical protein